MTSLLIWFFVIVFLINAAGTVCESNDFSTQDELWALMMLEVKLANCLVSQFKASEEQWPSVLLLMML